MKHSICRLRSCKPKLKYFLTTFKVFILWWKCVSVIKGSPKTWWLAQWCMKSHHNHTITKRVPELILLRFFCLKLKTHYLWNKTTIKERRKTFFGEFPDKCRITDCPFCQGNALLYAKGMWWIWPLLLSWSKNKYFT